MNHKKVFSLVICLCLMGAALSTAAYAAPTDGLCPHHTAHDELCGYVEAKAEVPCGHVCDASLGCIVDSVPGAPCSHETTHDATCGFVPATLPSCSHISHDDYCGGKEVVLVPCNHTCDIDEGCQYMGYCTHVHDAYCGYEAVPGICTHVCSAEAGCTEGTTGVPCGHTTHDELCGYAPAVVATCAHTVHDATCGYAMEKDEVPCTYALGCVECSPFLKAVVTVASDSKYDGTPKTPAVNVTIDGVALTEGVDYSLSYSDNVNAGTTALVAVTGMGTYAGQSTAEYFGIAPADISIVIGNYTKIYGEDDPAFDYQVNGLVAPDTKDAVVSGSVVRNSGENGEDVGEYVLVPSHMSVINSNYKINSLTRGKLTIDKKAITVTAEENEVIYGTAPDTSKVKTDTLAAGDTLASVTLIPSSTDVTTEGTVTPKDAVIKNALGTDVTKNYEISYAAGKLIITAKEVTPVIELSPNRFIYNGYARIPTSVKVLDGTTVIPATEYTISYTNNINVGTASASVADVEGGNYIIKPSSAPFSIIAQQQAQGYSIVIGNGQTYNPANYGMSFVVNAPAANLTGIVIDNQTVSPSYYTVAPYTNPAMPGVNGSAITLTGEFMNWNLLTNGTHSIVFVYSDGSATGSFIKGAASINGVRTGDDSAPGMMAIFMCLGLIGAASILPALRKQKN